MRQARVKIARHHHPVDALSTTRRPLVYQLDPATRCFLVHDRECAWTKDSTSFHIIGIEESSSGVLCTVFTKHNQRKVLNTSKEELLNMVDDPLLEIESTVTEAVEAIWPLPVRHSIGGKAPRIHTNTKPKTLKWFTCWCCDKMMSEYVEEPEHFGNITPCQDDLSVVAKDNEDTKEFGLTASRSTFDIFVPIDTKSSNESVSGAGTNY